MAVIGRLSRQARHHHADFELGVRQKYRIRVHRPGNLVREVHQIGFVLEVPSIDGVCTLDLVGRSVLKLRIWSVGTGFKS